MGNLLAIKVVVRLALCSDWDRVVECWRCSCKGGAVSPSFPQSGCMRGRSWPRWSSLFEAAAWGGGRLTAGMMCARQLQGCTDNWGSSANMMLPGEEGVCTAPRVHSMSDPSGIWSFMVL